MTVDLTQPDVLATATSWLSERTGLDFSGTRGRWLRDFVSATHRLDGGWLQRLLGGDPDAFAELCAEATVQESYFFREPTSLTFLRDRVLPSLTARPGRVRAWSAGCAGGEEAYTIAILLAEAGLGGRASVLGTDLVEAAVAKARRGVYGAWSLRGVEEHRADSRFRTSGNGFRVDPRRHVRVEFAQHNLLDGPPGAASFDLVLCRNVLIYFTPEAVRRAAKTLAQSMAPGGWLITGVSDPFLDVDILEPVSTAAGTVYMRSISTIPDPSSSGGGLSSAETRTMPRPEGALRGVCKPRLSRSLNARGTPPAVGRKQALPRSWAEDAELALLMAKPQQASELARAALSAGTERRRAHDLLIRALDADNRPEKALAAAGRAVDEFPLAAELRGLMAAALLQADRPREAQETARRALYLDPDTPLAHLVLARAAELLGDQRTARRARRNGHRLLERMGRS